MINAMKTGVADAFRGKTTTAFEIVAFEAGQAPQVLAMTASRNHALDAAELVAAQTLGHSTKHRVPGWVAVFGDFHAAIGVRRSSTPMFEGGVYYTVHADDGPRRFLDLAEARAYAVRNKGALFSPMGNELVV